MKKIICSLLSGLMIFGSVAGNVYADTTSNKTPVARGVDISYYQSGISLRELKNEGIDYAILRAGYGKYSSQEDIMFDEFVQQAQDCNMPIGAYWFSYATTPEEAEQEAYACLKVIDGITFQYPVWFDIETESIMNLSEDEICEIVDSFCSVLEDNGYYTGVYTYQWLANDKFNSEMDKYDVWLADIKNSEVTYKNTIGMWQNKIGLRVNNKFYKIDCNYSYKNYPAIMKQTGLNNN